MKHFKYLLIGMLFGIIMTKSEAVSWYRIQEMFRFQSIHMYGIIGTALAVGITMTYLMKKYKFKTIEDRVVRFADKDRGIYRYLFGGIIFGLGWALSGVCPGPMYTLIGAGYPSYLLVILSAVMGTLLYGAIKHRLPH